MKCVRLTYGVALVVLASACSSPSASERAQGTYVYERGNGVVRVALLPEDRFQMLFSLGRSSRMMDGSYALQADTITLTNRNGDEVHGLVSDTVLYLYMGGEDMVPFRRQ